MVDVKTEHTTGGVEILSSAAIILSLLPLPSTETMRLALWHGYDAESQKQDHEGEQTTPECHRVDITVPYGSQRHNGPPEAVKHGRELLRLAVVFEIVTPTADR